MTGRTLQRYRLLEEVGHGGMAVVYRGVDESLERDVAVKLLHPHLAARPEHRRRLLREAKAVARLHHPNILEIYDFSGEESPEAYIVTELIRGRTLKAFAQAHAFDPPELAAAATWVLAGALSHAHSQHIIHRDLKPENVMIREDGPAPVLKLMDFGIAQIIDRDERMTVTGSLIGSPAHMAPEIIDGEEADARSDLFSLGTILYWLATGELPFEAPSPGALLKRIVEGDYRDPRELKPAISDSLARVVQRSLARREERFQSADELREELGKSLLESGFARPEELVTGFLARPDEGAREARRQVVDKLIADGEKAALARKTARALACYARVIAMAPGTGEAGAARQAIDRLKSRVRWRRRGLVLAALSATGALAVSTWPDAPPDGPLSGRATTGPSRASDPPQPKVTWMPGDPGPKAEGRGERTDRPAVVGPPRVAHAKERGAEAVLRATPRAMPTPPPTGPPAAAGPAHLNIQVLPFARIAVDGQVVAETRTWSGDLASGPHHIELTHDCCAPLVFDATLQPGEKRELREKLVPRDGTLRLRLHGPPDAGIMMDDVFEKYVSELGAAPVVVKMAQDAEGKWRYDRDVRVRLFAKGYKDWVQTVLVRAGQALPVEVTMEPQG